VSICFSSANYEFNHDHRQIFQVRLSELSLQSTRRLILRWSQSMTSREPRKSLNIIANYCHSFGDVMKVVIMRIEILKQSKIPASADEAIYTCHYHRYSKPTKHDADGREAVIVHRFRTISRT
jgi:hypothetical protein